MTSFVKCFRLSYWTSYDVLGKALPIAYRTSYGVLGKALPIAYRTSWCPKQSAFVYRTSHDVLGTRTSYGVLGKVKCPPLSIWHPMTGHHMASSEKCFFSCFNSDFTHDQVKRYSQHRTFVVSRRSGEAIFSTWLADQVKRYSQHG